MPHFRLTPDRVIDSTDNNEFATGIRDENLLDDELVDEIPIDDIIPGATGETREGDRPIYDEMGTEDLDGQ